MAGDYAVEGEAMDTGVKAPGPEVDHGESPPPAPKPRVAVPDLNHDPPTPPNRDEGRERLSSRLAVSVSYWLPREEGKEGGGVEG